MIRKTLFGIAMTVFSLALILPVGIANIAEAAVSDTSEEVQPCNGYVWMYSVINGKKYMRLWDGTYQVWVTDWIPVEE